MTKESPNVARRAKALFDAADHKNLTWDLEFRERENVMSPTVAAAPESMREKYLEMARAQLKAEGEN